VVFLVSEEAREVINQAANVSMGTILQSTKPLLSAEKRVEWG
jgi:hypothetical protein